MDLEPGLRIAFILSIAVAFFSQVTGGVAANAQLDDILAGRQPASSLSELQRGLVVAQQASLLIAALSVAVAWHQTLRHPRLRTRRPAVWEGLVMAVVGACLGLALTLWENVVGQPTSFGQIRERLWLSWAQGFAWPLVILGLGLMTFFDTFARD